MRTPAALRPVSLSPRIPTAACRSVRSWSSEEYTRVVIYLSGPVHYTSSDVRGAGASHESARIRVDLADCTVGSHVQPHSNVNDIFLKEVSVKQAAPGLAQVVLDVRSVLAYRVFSMADPFRVVIDVRGHRPVQEQTAGPGASAARFRL